MDERGRTYEFEDALPWRESVLRVGEDGVYLSSNQVLIVGRATRGNKKLARQAKNDNMVDPKIFTFAIDADGFDEKTHAGLSRAFLQIEINNDGVVWLGSPSDADGNALGRNGITVRFKEGVAQEAIEDISHLLAVYGGVKLTKFESMNIGSITIHSQGCPWDSGLLLEREDGITEVGPKGLSKLGFFLTAY